MSIKISKDLAKFINKTCKDEGIDKAKYIDRLLWDGIKLDIKRVTEKTTKKREEKNRLARREFDRNEFSRGIL